MEENPEMFGTVIMLYINCRINGQHIKGFVDSGAQMTIMSSACARKCDLMRLVDSRFSGMAQGPLNILYYQSHIILNYIISLISSLLKFKLRFTIFQLWKALERKKFLAEFIQDKFRLRMILSRQLFL